MRRSRPAKHETVGVWTIDRVSCDVVDKPSNRPASEMSGTRADSSSYNASECGRETKWESERVSQTDWVAKAKEAIYTIFRINRYTHTYSSSLSGNLLSEVPAPRVYNLALHLH